MRACEVAHILGSNLLLAFGYICSENRDACKYETQLGTGGCNSVNR